MIKCLCLLVIATAMQARGEDPSHDPSGDRELDRVCRQGADATIVSWQEIERDGRPVDRRSAVCTPRIVAEPVERAGAGATG